jgi:hypothetical protein
VGLDELLILFIAPPWGDAFDRTSGVDLRRTTPPITEIVDFLLYRFSHTHLLCAIQVYEVVLPVSMAELRARFDWSTLRILELNTQGQNHGILLGTKGWAPQVIATQHDCGRITGKQDKKPDVGSWFGGTEATDHEAEASLRSQSQESQDRLAPSRS